MSEIPVSSAVSFRTICAIEIGRFPDTHGDQPAVVNSRDNKRAWITRPCNVWLQTKIIRPFPGTQLMLIDFAVAMVRWWWREKAQKPIEFNASLVSQGVGATGGPRLYGKHERNDCRSQQQQRLIPTSRQHLNTHALTPTYSLTSRKMARRKRRKRFSSWARTYSLPRGQVPTTGGTVRS